MIRAALVLGLWPLPAAALTLDLPADAVPVVAQSSPGAAALPVGPFAEGRVPVAEYPGQVSRQVWTVPQALSTWELAAPLEEQLRASGFRIRLSCETRDCGGFDFRFGIEVVPEPEMHVDLGDFRYITAERETEGGTEAVALLVSRSTEAGYVQVIAVEPGAAAPAGDEAPRTGVELAVKPQPGLPAAEYQAGTLAAALERDGHVVLDDVAFASGTAELVEGSYASLAELAEYLLADADRSVSVVGHTDAVGSLAGNVALSRRRAEAVRQRLVSRHGVPAGQVAADGVGFLAPRASNLSEAGRELNRRVEVVLTSTG